MHRTAQKQNRCSKTKFLTSTLLCFFAFFFSTSGYASVVEAIELTTENPVSTVGGRWVYFINEYELSPEQIIASKDDLSWQLEERNNASYSYDDREYWFHFRLYHEQRIEHDFVFHIAYPLLDEIDLYLVKGDEIKESFHTGDSFVFAERPIRHQNFIFPVSIDDEILDVFIRVKTTSTVQVPLTIWPQKTFWQKDKVYTYMDGLFFGAIVVMMLYNFFVYLSVKDRGYLYYVLYMLAMVSVQSANRGLGYQYLWPNSPFIQANAIVPTLAAVVMFASLFFISLLDLKNISRKSYNFFRAGVVATVVCMFAPIFITYAHALAITALVSIVVTVGGSLIAFNLWRKGNRLAGYYIAGWSAVIFAFIIYLASVFDLIPRNIFIEYATMIGAVAEVIIFSFALADRINLEKKIRLQTQASLLETQQEINKKLDIRVKQRTQELEVANAKLHEMSFSDGLTGVKNRRYFNERVQEEYKRAYREQSHLALLMIDIDYFKPINDTYGHQVGDDCLIAVARALKETVKRPGDAISRYGGEEFTILLPGTDMEGANCVAEKVRKAIENLNFVTTDQQKISLTISAGVVSFIPKIRDAVENFIKVADKQLYIAKKDGRNCVRSSDVEGE